MVDELNPFSGLFLAALAWFLLHKVVSGSGLRAVLVGRLGEARFRGLFSALSAITLTWLVWAYRGSPCSPLWTVPRSLLWLPSMVMPFAFLLLVGAFSAPRSRAAVASKGRAEVARGVLRITRHPFLWGVALWSGAHLIVNGNVPAALFFGSMLATALFGTWDIDRKHSQRDQAGFALLVAGTSNVPFAAILSGRNRLELAELLLPGILASALAALVMGFHQKLFHVSPFP